MDILKKAVLCNGDLSLTLIEGTAIVNKAIKYHNLTPLTSAGLGRTMLATLFMASTLKGKNDRLSVTVAGNGVGGKIIVSANSNLEVKGYIENPNVELPLNEKGKLDVRGLVGAGRITVLRSMGLKEPYVGQSEIVSGELAEDFAYYYTVSEQTPTAMALGVKTSPKKGCVGAGALIIQVLPFAKEESIVYAENLIKNFTDISAKIEVGGIEGIIKEYFEGVEFTDFYPKYKCACSKSFMNGIVKSLGKNEALSIINDMGKIQIHCEYCNKNYEYYDKDLEKLFK